MTEKDYIEREALIENVKRVYCTDCNSYNGVRCRACGTDDALDMIEDAPAADVAPRAEIAEEIFNEIAKMFSEKQRSYENSHQSGKARQMMVARFEVHKLHQKYKEAHNG